MKRSREEHKRPFKFTIEVEVIDRGWKASVDTDDGREMHFIATTPEEAERQAEEFCDDWAGMQPGTRRAYAYDYSPLITNRYPA